MNLNNPIFRAAVGGLCSAIAVDIHAWLKTGDPFDLKTAIPRWIGGAVLGLIAGLGVQP